MRRLVLLLVSAFAVGVAGCGGSGTKPVSVSELQATFARHGLHTFVVYNSRERSQRAYSVAVPVLVRGVSWQRFAPAFAIIADRKPSQLGSQPGTVQVEAYVFGTTADAGSAARACSRCLAARNVVVVVRDPSRKQVEAALSELR
jgi:hypothetical protein